MLMDLCGFNFDNTYTKLPNQFFTKLNPEDVPTPAMIILNDKLASNMGLDFSLLDKQKQAALFSGNILPDGVTPFAQSYAGHQFGHFAILGDGRAHILGEHISPSGLRFDIQLKGSGKTPYSRRGDGKAVLGPMLREYIISEAMHCLGIPTTRSLAVVKTGESVVREDLLPGAILTRTASSHIRVGTFEYASQHKDLEIIRAIMNYTIQRHFPNLTDSNTKVIDLIKVMMEKQIELVVHWMRVGFIHGVMNTDNMAVSGETIDYGPCAFMDAYDPNTVFSSIDYGKRYAFGNQPNMVHWNLCRFTETLLPLIDSNLEKAVSIAEEVVNEFPNLYRLKWLKMMCSKLGLDDCYDGDDLLINDLLNWMHKNNADYTNLFIDLSQKEKLTSGIYQDKAFKRWQKRWEDRLKKNMSTKEESLSLMKRMNPFVIPRNYKVEAALEAANVGNLKPLTDLLEVLKEPYKYRDALRPYQIPPKPNGQVYQTFCGT